MTCIESLVLVWSCFEVLVCFRGHSVARVVGGEHSLHLSEQMFDDLAKQNSLNLQEHRKLLLVLDLDHTVLHASMDPRAKEVYESKQFEDSLFEITLAQGGVGPSMKHYVKLRLVLFGVPFVLIETNL
jgi:hypothetical protein